MSGYEIRFYKDEDFAKIGDFCCGVENEPLDLYFKQEAHKDQKSGKERVYVIDLNGEIIGFFALKMASVVQCVDEKRKEIPFLQISDFAFDVKYQNKGYGSATFLKILELAREFRKYVGCVGIMVFVFHEKAIDFYRKMGFEEYKDVILETEYKDDFNIGCKLFIYSLIEDELIDNEEI